MQLTNMIFFQHFVLHINKRLRLPDLLFGQRSVCIRFFSCCGQNLSSHRCYSTSYPSLHRDTSRTGVEQSFPKYNSTEKKSRRLMFGGQVDHGIGPSFSIHRPGNVSFKNSRTSTNHPAGKLHLAEILLIESQRKTPAYKEKQFKKMSSQRGRKALSLCCAPDRTEN